MANYVTVSFEQIIAWNPEVILVTMSRKADVFKKIKEDRRWNTLSAVKNGLVYRTPGYPFNWFDRPPSPERILGMQWLANTLYPEYFPIDMKEKTREFFKLFYDRDLTDLEIEELIS